ncbi:MAG: tRNA guanosine(34) transglycosylase Tgt [Candidatus Gracilibacteria bacterium]|nr:tRNA guanosine(34) transglycosylase Tgt [Candidatus Gracilibacteria bacterium]
MFEFKVQKTDRFARAGTLTTPHGDIQTPIFMPVGTQASVKGIHKDHIMEIGSQIMLSNTYHLYLRPGDETIAHFGGLHEFMNVDIPILTDSGGFQVFSLGNMKNSPGSKAALTPNPSPKGRGEEKNVSLVKITEDGVEFRSHLDGSKHMFTPERAMQIQANLGADIIMAFDECAPGQSPKYYARAAMGRTHRWAERCVKEHAIQQARRESDGLHPQALFPIAQGVIFDDLRVESVKFIGNLPAPGMAIGGLSVGESKEDMMRILDAIAPHLPIEKPHYLMGVGTPEDLIEGIYRGIDMFDCVLPTRLGRHGVAYTSRGNIKVTNEKYRLEKAGIYTRPEYSTMVSRTYSLGYLRHLFKVGEMLAGQLVSLHNMEFLLNLAREARNAILEGRYEDFRKDFWSEYKI